MNYVPSATSGRSSNPEKKDNTKIILWVVIAALVGYIIYDKIQDNKVSDNLTTTKQTLATKVIDYNNLDSAKNILQSQFDIATAKIDTLSTNNLQLNSALQQRNQEITKKKAEIKAILTKSNATKSELKLAQEKIAELAGEVDTYVSEISKLKAENQQLVTDKTKLTAEKEQLTADKTQLSEDKKNLEDKVDVASTLSASHINITAIKLSGDKEKETETAKRANFFRISFVLDENRVAPSGAKALYIVVTNPDGKTSVANGNFKTRDGQDLQYTEKVDVNYEQGKVTPVSFDWKPGTQFVPGDYKVEIYNNGFKIGETKKTMKKGGLFS